MSDSTEERLDEATGVTIGHSGKPIVFYDDRSSRAAHSRDYVYVGAVRVNRMGHLRYYLWFGIWSTMSSGNLELHRNGFESVTLFADGEPLQLEIVGWTHDAIGSSGDIYAKPVASAADGYYEVTIDQLRLIAASRSLRILTSGPNAANYELWNSQKSGFASLATFLQPDMR